MPAEIRSQETKRVRARKGTHVLKNPDGEASQNTKECKLEKVAHILESTGGQTSQHTERM
jgi:hypothetical protein